MNEMSSAQTMTKNADGVKIAVIVHIGLTALLLEQDVNLFINTCYNYPTLSEMYKYAAYDAMGRKQRGEVVYS